MEKNIREWIRGMSENKFGEWQGIGDSDSFLVF
jgi:hypothetical protein